MLYVTPTNRQLLALRTSSVARPWDPPTQVALVQVGYDGIFHVNHLASYWGTQNKMETPTVYLYGFHKKRWTNDEPRMNQWWTHWITCFKAASFIVRTLFIHSSYKTFPSCSLGAENIWEQPLSSKSSSSSNLWRLSTSRAQQTAEMTPEQTEQIGPCKTSEHPWSLGRFAALLFFGELCYGMKCKRVMDVDAAPVADILEDAEMRILAAKAAALSSTQYPFLSNLY